MIRSKTAELYTPVQNEYYIWNKHLFKVWSCLSMLYTAGFRVTLHSNLPPTVEFPTSENKGGQFWSKSLSLDPWKSAEYLHHSLFSFQASSIFWILLFSLSLLHIKSDSQNLISHKLFLVEKYKNLRTHCMIYWSVPNSLPEIWCGGPFESEAGEIHGGIDQQKEDGHDTSNCIQFARKQHQLWKQQIYFNTNVSIHKIVHPNNYPMTIIVKVFPWNGTDDLPLAYSRRHFKKVKNSFLSCNLNNTLCAKGHWVLRRMMEYCCESLYIIQIHHWPQIRFYIMVMFKPRLSTKKKSNEYQCRHMQYCMRCIHANIAHQLTANPCTKHDLDDTLHFPLWATIVTL